MLAAVGQPVPDTAHAVSVSLPSWKANVGYEEGEDWVISKMTIGYPRFFIHLTIQELEREVLQRYGGQDEGTMLFPSPATARRCARFISDRIDSPRPDEVHILNLLPVVSSGNFSEDSQPSLSGLSCVFYPRQCASVAKQVWQHSGDGISSRRGEFCLKALQDGLLYPEGTIPEASHDSQRLCKGPRRYQRASSSLNGISHSVNGQADSAAQHQPKPVVPDGKEYSQFVEERFGRNLNAKLASKARLAIRRRISGCLTDDSELDTALETPAADDCPRRVKGLTENDVYLYPTGMSAIFNTHRTLMANNSTHRNLAPRKSICFGFPYIDTLKILQKWGPGCLFYGNGLDSDLDDLERRLEAGERYLALFTEFPSNPLLNSPDLRRIRRLADQYDFAVVVDESVGNFINVNVLVHADVVVSSLTKVFSGESNVMGGSAVLNPQSGLYISLTKTLAVEYEEDNYWAEDSVFMERNSREFISRIIRINHATDGIASFLHNSPLIKQVYYPNPQYRTNSTPSRPDHYESCRNKPSSPSPSNPTGGYGGLFSLTFHRRSHAVAFFDSLEVHKGPSLGTNFTLSCPYTILAHYGELDWAASFGVETDLVRVSVGLEDREDLLARFRRAVDAVAAVGR